MMNENNKDRKLNRELDKAVMSANELDDEELDKVSGGQKVHDDPTLIKNNVVGAK